MTGSIPLLCPSPSGRDEKKIRAGAANVAHRVVQAIAADLRHRDLIEEVYLAGLWHGANTILRSADRLGIDPDTLMKLPEPKREVDRIDVSAPVVRRRGRPRKAAA